MKVLLLIVCLAIGDTAATRLKRSIGGAPLRIDQAPYFVSIKQHEYNLCSGALITLKHILTAAHCVVDEFDKPRHNLRVVSGTAQKYYAGTVRNIQHLFLASGFDRQAFRNDVAVIVLSQHVKWDNEQYPTLLPSEELMTYGKAYFIAFASTDNPWQNTLLHAIQLKIRPIDFCIGYHPIGDDIYSDTICGLSDYYERPYKSDSGGPLVHHGKVVGLLSFSNSSDTFRNYFMDVYKFRDFIDDAKKCWTSSPCHSATSRYIFYPSFDG